MDNMDAFDDDLDHAIDAISEQVAHNTTRLDQLLSRLQHRLSRDYTHIPVAIGIAMVVGGFLHIFFRDEFVFSLTAMVWGALILCLTLFFQYRITGHLGKFGDALVKLDQDRQAHARKLAVIEKLIDAGIPENMSLDHLLILLGEYRVETRGNGGLDHDLGAENN
jgi:hypothetical protein